MRNTEQDYALIKSHGYRIDVRGPHFTLINELKARTYETMEQAIDAALIEIDPKLVRYRNGA